MLPPRRALLTGLALAALLPFPARLRGQAASALPPATTYLERYRQIMALVPDAAQSAEVRGLVLRRDVGELMLEEGRLYLLTPIAGQVVGAAFRGRGTFRIDPSLPMERERLRLFGKTAPMAEEFTELVLFFADSTLEELRRAVAFAPGQGPDAATPAPGFGVGPGPGSLENRVRQALDYAGDDHAQTLDVDLLRPLLNGERTGLFYAHVGVRGGDPWVFMLNPHELEGVQLLTRAKVRSARRYAEAVVQFPARGQAQEALRRERRAEARVRHYAIDVALPQTATGELAFLAKATLDIVADTAIGPWVAFVLYGKLEIDSAHWQGGERATVFKGKDSPYLWVRMPQRLAPGEAWQLQLHYRGDLIDRFDDWFFIKASIAWYPVSLDGRNLATFDLTFTSPAAFQLASVGTRTDSTALPGQQLRTRWVTGKPIRNASFNVGVFDDYSVEQPGLPPVRVLWSDRMHRSLARATGALAGRNMKQQVGTDIAAAIEFYQHVFGQAPVEQFYATEIPWSHGEAWPGIVGLSFVTFHQTSDQGEDEVFRAHEVAHQWFGIGVDYATYRDRWLSEGLSDFAGLWFLQTRRKDNDKYFGMLRRWRTAIQLRRGEPLPIWLGHRVSTSGTGEDYGAIVYEKGAFVMHMLRILMLDLKTMKEERFVAMMQDFYGTYQGKRASTADLQRVVEAHTGQPMQWFFDQWIYGTGMPTYNVAWRAEPGADGSHVVRLRVRQERVPPEFLAYVPVTVDLGGGQLVRVRVKVTGSESEIVLPPLPAKPREVRFNDFEGVLAEVKTANW